MYPPLVFLNGAFVPPTEAQVSVFDRGFVFADGVYEVIPAYGGRLFRMPQHLARLERSLQAVRIGNPFKAGEWEAICLRLLAAQAVEDQYIYLQVTRGPAARDHAFPKETKPTVFAYAQPIKYPEPAQLAAGVAAITVPDIRWRRCDIKAVALLANVLLRQQASEAGAAEAFLIRDGLVTEGSASNLFLVSDGVLVTPGNGPFILTGVTRDLVLELARAHGIRCAERDVHDAELGTASELMLSSSTRELLPVTTLDGRAVGNGRPGPVQARLYTLYQEYKHAFRAGRVN